MSDYEEETINYELIGEESHYFKLMGELYKTLDTTQTIQTSDTLYSNDLIIGNVNDLDAGKYLCCMYSTKNLMYS